MQQQQSTPAAQPTAQEEFETEVMQYHLDSADGICEVLDTIEAAILELQPKEAEKLFHRLSEMLRNVDGALASLGEDRPSQRSTEQGEVILKNNRRVIGSDGTRYIIRRGPIPAPPDMEKKHGS